MCGGSQMSGLTANSPAYLVLVQEKAILEKKVELLDNFVKSARLGEQKDLTTSELQLLEEQLHYMRGYLRCLNCRIGAINEAS